MRASFRQLLLRRGRDFRDVRSDSAQIASLSARVNVDGALNVVVADHRWFLAAAHRGQIFQKLRLRCGWRVDRDGPQRVDRVDLVLRRLHRDRVADAVRRKPEVRSCLEAGAQRHQNVVGDVPFGQPYLLRSHAVHREVQPRLIEQLVQMHIDGAGHRADLFGHSAASAKLCAISAADDLNVDRAQAGRSSESA